MIPLLFLAASAQAALFSPSLLRRGLDELWNGYNITAAALEIASSISSPTCNSTTYCQTFVKQVIPQCLQLQGTAGCWCTLHDPLHYCAICMSSPTDNTTTAEQTQTALEGHTNYHKGCAAYQAYLNASATSTSMSSVTLSTSTSTGTAAASNSGSSSSLSTGAMVGIIVAGIIGLVLILAVTFLLYRRMQNQSKLHEVTTATGGGGGAALGGPREDMSPNGDPQRVTSYYGKMDMNGNVDYSQQTHTNGSVQQPLMFQQQQQLQHPHMSPIPSPHSAAPFMPYGDVNSVHPPSSPGYTARPESMMYAGSESDATGSVQQGPLRVMTTSPPPAFNTIYAPQAHYATQANSMTGMASGGGGVPPGVNEKAVYQGSPSPGRQM